MRQCDNLPIINVTMWRLPMWRLPMGWFDNETVFNVEMWQWEYYWWLFLSLFWEQKSNQKTLWLAERAPSPASTLLER